MFNLPIKILQTRQIESATGTVTFTGINTLVAAWDARARVTSRHLVLIINAASPDAVAQRDVILRFNADGGANYSFQGFEGEAAAATANRFTAQTLVVPFPIPGTTYANAFGGGIILIPHAFNSSNHKAVLSLGGAVEDEVEAISGRWASVAAIVSMALSLAFASNFVVGSTFHLGVIDERYLVEEVDLAGGAAASVIFDNIPQGEGDLSLIIYGRSNLAAARDSIFHYINDDKVAASYFPQQLYGDGAVETAVQYNLGAIGMVAGATAPANAFGANMVTYSQYTKGNQPHFLHLGGAVDNILQFISGRRNNIEPINKLEFYPQAGTQFNAGCLFSLYRVPKRVIGRVELAAPVATVTFANIPQNFEALILHVYARSSEAAVADEIAITINADAVAANYDFQELTGAGAVHAAARNLASQQLLYIPANNEGAGEYGGGSALFPSYAETNRHKHIIALHGQQENRVAISSHRWESLNAITTIVLSPVGGPNFLAGSVFELEGILRREGLPPSEGMRV